MPDIGYRPTVSVIVPAKNEEEVIQKTITAILDSDYTIQFFEQ
jgi:glycosyltransferase involved in cell wall biosynthesis